MMNIRNEVASVPLSVGSEIAGCKTSCIFTINVFVATTRRRSRKSITSPSLHRDRTDRTLKEIHLESCSKS